MNADTLSARDLFLAALKVPPEAWPAYLAQACRGDAALQRRVEELLAAHLAAGSFLSPATAGSFPAASGATLIEPGIAESPGAIIGPYKLLEVIGEGGMGTVYLAEQTEPVHRKVALKLIKPGMDTHQVIARFEAERQALALMDHPNIARVFDAGATPSGRPYFVMELVTGLAITDYCDQKRLGPRERLELFVPVCQAVQHAHQKGIIHRDIKPSNVLVTSHDDPVVKVIDFGIAKATSGQALTDMTLFTGLAQLVGTPLYMSPEQADLSGIDIDTRSDIYSLGVLLYELLTGTTPFDRKRLKAAAYDEIRRIIREEEPPRPSTRLSELNQASPTRSRAGGRPTGSPTVSLASISAVRRMEPRKLNQLLRGELDWIVMKALEKDRNRRYETANGLAADVLRYLADEPVAACPPSAAYRFRKFVRRNKAALATAVSIAAALFVAVVGLVVSNVLVTAERDRKIEALSDREAALEQKGLALIEAKRHEGLAQASAERAREAQEIAEKHELLAKRRYYAAQMNLAMQAWRSGDAPRVLELLEGQRPGPDEQDLRGFEWYYLWRLCNSGRNVHLHGHTGAVLSLAFSPDGKTLASASWDRTIRLWDPVTGKQRKALRGHPRGPWHVAQSPDGRWLASSGSETGSLILWDVATGKPVHTIDSSVAGLAFSPDSSMLAGGVVDESRIHGKVWDVASGAERLTLVDAGIAIGFLGDGKKLATGWGQFRPTGEVRIWNLESGQREMTIPTYFDCAVLSPDGTRAATSSGHQGIDFWDVATGKSLGRIPTEGPTGMRALAFSPDGKRLAGGGEGRAVTVWEIETGRRLGQDVHLDHVWAIAFAPDGNVLASSTLGGAIKVWDMTPADDATTISNLGYVTVLRFTADGSTLLTGTGEQTRLIDPVAGKVTALLPERTVISISDDANTLALRTDTAWIIRDLRPGQQARSIPLKKTSHNWPAATISPDGSLLATFEPWTSSEVKLWDVSTQQARTFVPDPPESNRNSVHCAAFSPDGKLLAAGFGFQWVVVWDVTTGNVKLQFSQPPAMMNVLSLAFSSNGKSLAVGTDVGTVTLWNVETGERLAAFKGHASAVTALDFSPDGGTLATACVDRTVKLWDVITGQERSTFTGHTGQVAAVRFSPDGATLATAARDGTIKLWRAATDPEALARRTSLERDDPRYLLANQYHSSAWSLATADKIGERDPPRAVELAEKAIRLRPNEERFWQTLGVARYRCGEWREALAALDKSEALAPGKYVHQQFFRAMALWRIGNKEEARACYDRASEWIGQHAPYDPWVRSFQREAAELLELSPPASSLPKLPPGAIDVKAQLAEFLRRRGALDERAATAPEPRAERRNLAAEYFQLAVELRDFGQLVDSEAVCRQALERFLALEAEGRHDLPLDSDIGWATHLLADVLSRVGRFEEAAPPAHESIKRFRTLVDVHPDEPGPYDALVIAYGPLSHILAGLNKPDESIQTRRNSLAASQAAAELRTSSEELLDAARACAEKRDWKQAASKFDRAFTRQRRNDAFLCFSTALARLLAEDIEGYARLAESMPAMEALPAERLDVLRTCTIHPRGAADPAAMVTLAQAVYDEAADNWSTHNLGMAHYRAGHLDRALKSFDEAITITDWYLFFPALAMVHHRLGHADEARQYLDRANTVFRDYAGKTGDRLKSLDQDPFWQDWAYFEVMLQEARTLLPAGKP